MDFRWNHQKMDNDNFLQKFDDSEIQIAAEFLSNWLPYLSRGLCKSCTRTLSDGIRSLHREENFAVSTPRNIDINQRKDDGGNCIIHSIDNMQEYVEHNDDRDTHSLGSWKDEAEYLSEQTVVKPSANAMSSSLAADASHPKKKSWADITMEAERAEEEVTAVITRSADVNGSSMDHTSEVEKVKQKLPLSWDQRESLRFSIVERKKDFECFERVNGRMVNILEGLELHKGIFSAKEQKRIVNYVEELQEMGVNGELKERTYSAPQKWMRGKGRITLQFGCCYNYATDRQGNPPGILKNEMVDPLPNLFKVMIRRLVRWHVLPPSCVPDSCIVNIYEDGDCIPPHIDSHDFVRPFCTVSFLSECEILFGSNLKIMGPGEFSGSFALPLPVGSVLVLSGNGADVAKHCVPAVPAKRISITFRKMDASKRPSGYDPEPDLQGLLPLTDEADRSNNFNNNNTSTLNKVDSVNYNSYSKPQNSPREDRVDRWQGTVAENPDPRYSSRRQGSSNRRRF